MNDLLRQYPPPIRETVDRLRGIVHAIAPGAREKVNRGWRSINYLDPQVGYFCGIFPFEDKVDLIFEFGTLLPDPERMFRGRGKTDPLSEIPPAKRHPRSANKSLHQGRARPASRTLHSARLDPIEGVSQSSGSSRAEAQAANAMTGLTTRCPEGDPSGRALREWSPSDLPSKADRGCAGIFRREWKAGLLVEPSKSQPRPLQWHTNMMREVK